MIKQLCILGSTGSIGTQALNIAKKHNIEITGLCSNSNIDLLEKQAREFKVAKVAVFDEKKAKELKIKLNDTNTKVLSGEEGVCELAQSAKGDTILNSIVGIAGLNPTVHALSVKKNIALANKETLVAGGDIVMALAKKNNCSILPVDSEHSAIFQCLLGCKDKKELKSIILTASGGPFYSKTKDELKDVKPKDALKHPNWSMGAKITTDSATLMNKGLEVIEACHLFNVTSDKIKVVVHRESIVHSAVEFCDNSVIAQMGNPDMAIPIQFALSYPFRYESPAEPLDIFSYPSLSFLPLDNDTFSTVELCKKAIDTGGTMPCALNGANEKLVSLFLEEKIKFLDIFDCLNELYYRYKPVSADSLENIFEADRWARGFAENFRR